MAPSLNQTSARMFVPVLPPIALKTNVAPTRYIPDEFLNVIREELADVDTIDTAPFEMFTVSQLTPWSPVEFVRSVFAAIVNCTRPCDATPAARHCSVAVDPLVLTH